MMDDRDPVQPSELILRRVSVRSRLYEDGKLQIQAFRPNERDQTGLSLYRERFITPEELAWSGPSLEGYWVAALDVSKVLAGGMTVVPSPQRNDLAGHVEIPELTYDRRRTAESLERMEYLASACIAEVLGPFPSGRTPPA